MHIMHTPIKNEKSISPALRAWGFSLSPISVERDPEDRRGIRLDRIGEFKNDEKYNGIKKGTGRSRQRIKPQIPLCFMVWESFIKL